MMTSVVACGNGTLSGGLYRGIASEAQLVLVKCGTMRRIEHDDIRRGLDWVVRNRKRYGIRIVNVSCGGDYEASYLKDALSQAAERAAREGVLVCAAAGNAGPRARPSGAAAGVRALGAHGGRARRPEPARLRGVRHVPLELRSDRGRPAEARGDRARHLGGRADPARHADRRPGRAAAPPGDGHGRGAARDAGRPARASTPTSTRRSRPTRRSCASWWTSKIRSNNVISGAYKHVDGTSFAAPIVSSVAAQMLEANPRLQPLDVKRLLITTARRIAGIDPDRQGWGVVDAARAVAAAQAAAAPRARRRA